MVDIDNLKRAIRTFESSARIPDGHSSRPCTAEEYSKLVEAVQSLARAFVKELEQDC